LRDRQIRAELARLVGPDHFEQETPYRIEQHHQNDDLPIAAAERVEGP
jgi:hypothetical protein